MSLLGAVILPATAQPVPPQPQALSGSTLGGSNGDPEQFDRGAMLGSTIGIVSGLRSAENTRIVQIPQSSVYILSLEAPIQLSAR